MAGILKFHNLVTIKRVDEVRYSRRKYILFEIYNENKPLQDFSVKAEKLYLWTCASFKRLINMLKDYFSATLPSLF